MRRALWVLAGFALFTLGSVVREAHGILWSMPILLLAALSMAQGVGRRRVRTPAAEPAEQ